MGNDTQEKHALITDFAHSTGYSEALRTLYANIRFQWENDANRPARARSLLITTPKAYGDYAAVAANLAIVVAQSGTDTILVDADLRSPGYARRFGVEKPDGLSDLLLDESLTSEKINDALQSTFVPGLRLLGAGTPSSQVASLLFSPRLEKIVQTLYQCPNTTENANALVIFHSPPVLAGADAALIGALVEQTALAIIVNHTTRAQAIQAQQQLQQAHAHLIGVVMLNQ
ncbi:MAG TPA: CpsD/CapB family tyrosine-protein kinase [Ktedonobacteraceae bacterium]|nr:CpsD/CapB family tyrosine-protein kinase [Ktedonobacteraceae bacterium]